MNSVFFNDYGRVRSGWRAGVFLVAFAFFETGWVILVKILSGISSLEIREDSLPLWGADLFVNLLLAIILGWACGKIYEGLPPKALGWAFYRGWLRHLIAGLLIGVVELGLACLICIVFGGLSFHWNKEADAPAIGNTLLVAAVIFILNSAAEETMFRGYLLQTFARAKLAWVAILLTSLFFTAGHLGNPNTSALGLINTLLAGLWFSFAYLKTRSLWLPFGAHFAWNFVQGAILGIPVSGITRVTPAPLLQQVDSGPAWLTGGSYGIEGGIACTIGILLSTALLYFLPIKADEEMMELTSKEHNE